MYGWAMSLLIRDLGLRTFVLGLVVAIATGLFYTDGMLIGGRFFDRISCAPTRRSPCSCASVSCVGGGALGISLPSAP